MNLQSEHTCCGFTEPRRDTMLPSISSFALLSRTKEEETSEIQEKKKEKKKPIVMRCCPLWCAVLVLYCNRRFIWFRVSQKSTPNATKDILELKDRLITLERTVSFKFLAKKFNCNKENFGARTISLSEGIFCWRFTLVLKSLWQNATLESENKVLSGQSSSFQDRLKSMEHKNNKLQSHISSSQVGGK